MSTTVSGAGPGEPLGGAETPTQEFRRPDTAPPPTRARDERRRLSALLARAAADLPTTGPAGGAAGESPWQRSAAVWRHAGLDWTGVEPPSAVASASAAREVAASDARAAATFGVPASNGLSASDRGAAAAYGISASDGGPDAAYGVEPWAPPRRGPLSSPAPVAAVVAFAVALGLGAYALIRDDGSAPRRATSTASAAVIADRLFAADPAARSSGLTHRVTDVAASGDTVVAVAAEQGDGYAHGQFLTSADGGRTWQLAQVRAADGGGGDPLPGEYPRLVAGGTGAWAALGRTPTGSVPWTSQDGRVWTRHAVAGAFDQADRVTALARTRSGFVAVGTTATHDGTRATGWISTDGRTWTRVSGPAVPATASPAVPPLDAGPFQAGDGGVALRLSQLAVRGDTVVAQGVLQTKKAPNTVRSTAFWRSADGGRSWAPVRIAPGGRPGGEVLGIAATRTGFVAARAATRKAAADERRPPRAYAVILGSPDGRTWTSVGRLATAGYSGIELLRGTDRGLTCLVRLPHRRTAVLTSADGKTWRRVAELPPGRDLTAAALAPAGPVLTGGLNDGVAYLAVAGVRDVDLRTVPGAVHAERMVAAVASDAGKTVAAGGTNGDAALWASSDGSSWARAKPVMPPPAGPRRLLDVVHGVRGWLAVGQNGDRPFALTSRDGTAWRVAGVSAGRGGAVAAAANGRGYVVVGRAGSRAAAWYSPDLRRWLRAGGGLGGGGDASARFGDVAAGSAGFVAVGGRTTGGATHPAVWTSPDGRRWSRSAAPPALPPGATEGSLTSVAVHGGTLVAAGTAGPYAFAAVSVDGGRVWRTTALPGALRGTAVTAATATPRGVVLAGTAGSDVVLWSSSDGGSWRVWRPHGTGLDGTGVQRLTGLTVAAGRLLAVGFTAGYRDEAPTLWRTPLP